MYNKILKVQKGTNFPKLKSFNDKYGGIASAFSSGINSLTDSLTGNQSTGKTAETLNGISDGISSITSSINPLGGAINSVGKLAGNLIGGTEDRVEGAGSAAVNAISSGLSMLGPIGMAAGAALQIVNGIGGQRVKKVVDNTKYISSEFSGSKKNISDNISKYSNKKAGLFDFGFGKKGNEVMDEIKRKQNITLGITEAGQKRLDNDIATSKTTQNFGKFYGYTPSYLPGGKKGMKFPELEEAKNLISHWSIKSTKEEPQKFQLGGKMNLIPEGALHARKHQIEEVDSNLEGQITKKGIPVITKADGGIIQTAEIEKEEWTLRKEFTDQLESLYHLYQKDGSSEVAIKAGKLICYELLKNTDDRSGLIKNIK